MGEEGPAEVVLGDVDEDEGLLRDSGGPQALGDECAASLRLGRGLEDGGGTCGEGREDSARGDREGEVPRRRDEGEGHGAEFGAVDPLEFEGGLGVVVGEVGGLGYFDVGLLEGLAEFGSGDLDEVGAAAREFDAGAVEDLGAFGGGLRAPLPSGFGCGPHQCVEGFGVLDEGGPDGVDAEGRGGHAGRDPARPFEVRGERRVGVGGVREGPGPVLVLEGGGQVLGGFREAVLVAGRADAGLALGPHLVDGGEEARALLLEGGGVGSDVEDRGHEVLVGGVLLEAAHEVGDRDVVLLGVDDGDVEEEVSDLFAHGRRLLGRHAREHLEFDFGGDAALLGELPCACDGEEVVTGDAEVDVRRAFGAHRPVEDADVVGVGRLLGVPGREVPSADLGFDAFHREVRALDDADLDGGSAARPARSGPFLEVLHRVEGVGQVGLEDDAGAQAEAVLAVEDLLEDVDGEVEVVVLLHVEVDELAPGLGGVLVEGEELADGVLDDLLVAPGVVGAGDGRDFEGDVVDVGALEESARVVESLARLLLAEDRFAEEVHVEAGAAGAEALDRGAELLVGDVDDEVADEAREDLAGRGDREVGEEAAGLPADEGGRAQVPGEELGVLVAELAEVAGRDPAVLGPDDPVDEGDGVVEAVLVVEDSREELRGGVDRMVRRGARPPAGGVEGAVDDRGEVGAVGHCVVPYAMCGRGWARGQGPGPGALGAGADPLRMDAGADADRRV